jgi:hypothetical protein
MLLAIVIMDAITLYHIQTILAEINGDITLMIAARDGDSSRYRAICDKMDAFACNIRADIEIIYGEDYAQIIAAQKHISGLVAEIDNKITLYEQQADRACTQCIRLEHNSAAAELRYKDAMKTTPALKITNETIPKFA